MPREIKVKSIRDQLPTRYCHHQAVRFFMIAFAGVIIAYSLYFLLRFVNAETPNFFKLLPLIIMFVGLDSVLRQTTSLNCVTFYEDRLKLSFLLKKSLEIPYENIRKLEIIRRITFYVHLKYIDLNGQEQLFKTPASFPKILEIILNIADLAPNAELNELLSKAVELLRTKVENPDEQQV